MLALDINQANCIYNVNKKSIKKLSPAGFAKTELVVLDSDHTIKKKPYVTGIYT